MPRPTSMIMVAGAELYDALETEKERTVPMNGQYFQSEPLCRWQSEVSRRGILGAEVIDCTPHGCSVRYDSGLQNFGLLAGSRCGMLDGSLEDAERWARAWVAEDPTRRYAWRRKRTTLAELLAKPGPDR